MLAYGVFLRFFVTELAMRPVLADVSCALPDGADLGERSVPLRTKLLVALPVINVVTGVVVAGLASEDPSLRALGVGVLVALVVAFTLSFELSALLARSVVEPIQDLREGTERVTAGDLGVRVPVLGTDETGRLAESFNQMVAGLEERERLREAFGAFVDPQLAERVLEEGTVIEGEEVEVTVLFVDIREFTAFAERASATEVVTELNAFYELVVPVLVRHGGHANKFIGDGLLGVFGAPEHLDDHADRGVAAALEIAEVVRRRLRRAAAHRHRRQLRAGGGRDHRRRRPRRVRGHRRHRQHRGARGGAHARDERHRARDRRDLRAAARRARRLRRARHGDPARAQRAGHAARGDGRGGRAGRAAGARARPGSTASPTRTVPGAATSHHTPKATSRLPRRPARARRIGRSPWPSSGSRIVTTQRSVGTATRRVAVPMATSRPAQPSSSHARAPSIEIVMRKRRGSTTAPSRASRDGGQRAVGHEGHRMVVAADDALVVGDELHGAPEVLGQRGGEGPLDDAPRHRAPVVERGRDGLAAHDRRRDAPAVGEGERQLLLGGVPAGHDLHEARVAHRQRDLAVGLADVEGAIADRSALDELERVGLDGPHPLDRGDGEGGDAKHRGMVAW